MSKIEEIYYDQSENFVETSDVKKAWDDFDKYLKKTVLNQDDYMELCDLANRHSTDTLYMGFEYGFKYAVALIKECLDA